MKDLVPAALLLPSDGRPPAVRRLPAMTRLHTDGSRCIAGGTPLMTCTWLLRLGERLQRAIRGGFKWFERVSSFSNLADRPSRGLAPECPCGWRLREVVGVRRWGAPDGTGPGRPWVAF